MSYRLNLTFNHWFNDDKDTNFPPFVAKLSSKEERNKVLLQMDEFCDAFNWNQWDLRAQISDDSNEEETSRAPIDWATKVGTFVPLRIIPSVNRRYLGVVQFVDEDYMEYYDENLVLPGTENTLRLSNSLNGWAVKDKRYDETLTFVHDFNEKGIPQADTLEWEYVWDSYNGEDRVLFYPYFPEHVGE